MKVKIEILGPARNRLEKNPADFEMPEGSKLLDLMRKIGYSDEEAKFLVYVRGEDRLTLFSPLLENDYIKAVLQVGGG